MATSDRERKSRSAPPAARRHGRLPGSVILLSWVSFFADVSGEMVFPLIPLFVVGVLGASAATLGGIEGAALCIVAFMNAWAGWHSDRRRSRIGYVRAGYALPIVGKALLATASAPAMVLVGRLTDRFGKGLRSSPRDALITDMVDPSVRGRAFGFHRMLDTAGALAGVLIAAALMWWLVPAANHGSDGRDHPGALSESANAFRIIFAVASALGLASLALVWLVRDPKSGARDSRHAPEASGRRTRFGVTPDCWRVIALVLIFTLANSTDTFLLLRAGELGHSPFSVVMVYAVFNVTYAAVSYPAGIWSDRLGRWKVIGMGWLIYAAVYAGFAITNAAWVWPLMALYGVFMAFTDGVSKALITDHAPSERRGTALGIFYCLTGLATLLSSYLTGLIWDRVGASAALWLGAGIAAFAVVLIPVLRPGPRPTGKSAA